MMVTTMTTIEEDCQVLLPDEITTEILSRLPSVSVIQCKLVCKTWRALIADLIADPVFIDLHTHRLSVIYDQEAATKKQFGFFLWTRLDDLPWTIDDYEPDRLGECFGQYYDHHDEKISKSFKLSGRLVISFYHKRQLNWTFMNSCNGLIFMATLFQDKMAICNPFTREFVDILPESTTEGEFEYSRESGFGYNPSTNEYKIVIVRYKEVDSPPGKVSVYTLGSGKWRYKGETSYVLGGYINVSPSLHLNGAVYWVNQSTSEIVLFDLETEEFRIVPSPPLPPGMYYERLGSLGGCLYVIRKKQSFFVKNYCDVLVRNEEDYTWTEKFSITNEKLCSTWKPLAILKSGKILWHSAHDKPYVVCYDPETGSLEMDEDLLQIRWVDIIPYVKTLVSLKVLGETNAQIKNFRNSSKRQLAAGS